MEEVNRPHKDSIQLDKYHARQYENITNILLRNVGTGKSQEFFLWIFINY